MTKRDNINKEDYKENKNISSKEELLKTILESGQDKFVNSFASLQGIEFVTSYIDLLRISKTKSLAVDQLTEEIKKVKFI